MNQLPKLCDEELIAFIEQNNPDELFRGILSTQFEEVLAIAKKTCSDSSKCFSQTITFFREIGLEICTSNIVETLSKLDLNNEKIQKDVLEKLCVWFHMKVNQFFRMNSRALILDKTNELEDENLSLYMHLAKMYATPREYEIIESFDSKNYSYEDLAFHMGEQKLIVKKTIYDHRLRVLQILKNQGKN